MSGRTLRSVQAARSHFEECKGCNARGNAKKSQRGVMPIEDILVKILRPPSIGHNRCVIGCGPREDLGGHVCGGTGR